MHTAHTWSKAIIRINLNHINVCLKLHIIYFRSKLSSSTALIMIFRAFAVAIKMFTFWNTINSIYFLKIDSRIYTELRDIVQYLHTYKTSILPTNIIRCNVVYRLLHPVCVPSISHCSNWVLVEQLHLHTHEFPISSANGKREKYSQCLFIIC